MSQPDSNQGSTVMQWLLAILANVTLFTYGLQCGWINIAIKSLQSPESPTGKRLSDEEISWLAGAPSLSATACVTLFTYIVDKYGRKYCIIAVTLFQAISWGIKLCPSSMTSLMVARISCGIAGAGCFSIIPMYVKEISQDNLRGSLGMILITSQNVGIFAMYAMGGYLSYNAVLRIVVGIPILNALVMLKAPESPSFLVKVGKEKEATAAIALLRGREIDDKLVHYEIDAMKLAEEKFKTIPTVTYIEILKNKAWRRGFLFMIMLMMAHGAHGGFSVVSYASTILGKFGVTINPVLQSLSIPTFMIFGSLLSMVCIERLGRKVILTTSFVLSAITFASLAAILLVQENGGWVPGFLPIFVIVLSVTAYAMGVSPIPFVLMSEMFNFQIRAKVMGVLVTTGWMFCFVQLLGFGPISSNFGAHTAFLCFTAINIYGAFVILVLIPETQAKSVEQIEMELEKRVDKK